MSTDSRAPRPDEPWRDRLARRLSLLSVMVAPLVFAPIVFGTSDPTSRIELIGAALVVSAAFVYLARCGIPARRRRVGVVAAFAAIGVMGYATVGFLSAPGVAFATSVVLAGLLLGRRAVIVTAVAAGALVLIVSTLMIRGILPAPSIEDISPVIARAWLRDSAVTLLLVIVLGATVTWAVQAIETALARVDQEARRREAAEEQMLQAQRRDLMSRLAAGLAHDVNNQLTVISTWSALLASPRRRLDPTQAHEAIAEAVANAGALTKQLLVLGRRDVRDPRPLSLATLVKTYEPTLRGFLPADIDVRIESEDPAWCRADEAQLNSVLLNLALNARDAMGAGGVLTVRTLRRRNEREVQGIHGPVPPGDWAVLEVEDEGIGMDATTRRRAFDPFFTTKKIGKGAGLGLATIAAIAEQSDGHVVLHSTPGQGTRVEVWVPTVAPERTDEHAAIAPTPHLRGVRVLLCEDTPGLLAAAREALTEAGCTVVTATDGDEALARVGESRFDLLCSDVVMPGAPIADVLDAFVAANPRARVLLCSGYVGEDLVLRGIWQGRYDFLAKPYTLRALLNAVGRVLAAGSVRARLPQSDPATA